MLNMQAPSVMLFGSGHRDPTSNLASCPLSPLGRSPCHAICGLPCLLLIHVITWPFLWFPIVPEAIINMVCKPLYLLQQQNSTLLSKVHGASKHRSQELYVIC